MFDNILLVAQIFLSLILLVEFVGIPDLTEALIQFLQAHDKCP